MANVRAGLHRALAISLLAGAAIGALSRLALLVTALTGRDTASSYILGGFGLILLIFSAMAIVTARRQWAQGNPDSDA